MRPIRRLTEDERNVVRLARRGVANLVTVLGRIEGDRTIEEALRCLELCDLWLLKAEWPREPVGASEGG
jgi:hypothetical protein